MRLQVILKNLAEKWECGEELRKIVNSVLEMYNGEPVLPWAGYLVMRPAGCSGEEAVGTCAFKSAPVDNRVEIAYHTFPEYEGKGIATKMAEMLIMIARRIKPDITLVARTLPVEGASTSILKKHGFVKAGTVTDPEDGEVWEWVLEAEKPQ